MPTTKFRNIITISRWEIIDWDIHELAKLTPNKYSASEICELLDDTIVSCENFYGLKYIGHLKDRDEDHLYEILDYTKFIFNLLKRHIKYNIPTEQQLNESSILQSNE